MSQPENPDGERSLVFRLNENGGGPELIRQVFLEKGWTEYNESDDGATDWNLWWRTSRFRQSDYERVEPWQRLNHYPKTTAITKKDGLARNLKCMKGVYAATGAYNFSPLAFNLPNDYTKFVAEYTRHRERSSSDQYWICKPADLSRGRGIFIIKDLSELQYDCNAVLQRYIMNPLLIGGYKFDLRIYVLVPSFHPLQVYIYEEGLVRFSTEKYDLGTLRNMFSHLTNTSINKFSPAYMLDKERVGSGCKWTITQLRHYLRQSNIDDVAIWGKIINIVILTLVVQASQVPTIKNCFELYGFDIMIDDNLKPWLLEVNFSPALSHDCQADITVKKPLLSDIIDMMGFTEHDKDRGKSQKNSSSVRPGTRKPPSRKKSFTATHKAASKSPRDSDNVPGSGPLPLIQQSSIGPQNDTQVVESDNEVIPLMPGCGLPSVQRSTIGSPPQHRSPSVGRNNSMTTSELVSASRKNSQGALESSSRETGGLRVTQDLSNNSVSPVLRSYNRSPYRSGMERRGREAGAYKFPLYKRDSKFSTHSDSGISSHSGSSDNSDNSLCSAKMDQEMVRAQRRLYESLPNHPTTDQPVMERRRYRAGLYGALSGKGSNKRSLGTRLARVNYTKGPAVSSDNSEQQENLGQTTKSPHEHQTQATKSKESGQQKAQHYVVSRKPANYGKTTVWRHRSHHGGNLQLPSKSDTMSAGGRVPPRRVGDFVLVFPFSKATQKCTFTSYGNTSVKTVISECQTMLKTRTKVMGSHKDERTDTESGWEDANDDKSEPMIHDRYHDQDSAPKPVPWIWPVLRDHTGSAH